MVKKYKTFSEQVREEYLSRNTLKEGLIYSFTYNKFENKLDHLLKKFDFLYYDIDIKEDGIYLTLSFYKKQSKELFDSLYSFLNLSGYYISKHKIGEKWFKTNLNISDYFSNTNIELIFNKKFDFMDTGIKCKLFHVTDRKHLDKILKNGLTTKTNKMIDNQPERIYFFDTLNNVEKFVDYKLLLEPEFDPCVLQVDVEMLKKIKLYSDPKFPLSDAFYTYDSIPPHSLTVKEI